MTTNTTNEDGSSASRLRGVRRRLGRGTVLVFQAIASSVRQASVTRACRDFAWGIVNRFKELPSITGVATGIRRLLRRQSPAKMPKASTVARDAVDQASWESFPASDPPGY